MAQLELHSWLILSFHESKMTQKLEAKEGHSTAGSNHEQEMVQPHVELIRADEWRAINGAQAQEHLDDAGREGRVAIMGAPFHKNQNHHIAEE